MNRPTMSGAPTDGGGFGPGSILGPYTLLEPLGRGGMGQVWKATDGKRAVALKVLPPEFRGNSAAIAQVDEAFQMVHSLTHEHICKTLGLFDDPHHGPHLVMDYISGITLTEFQLRGGFPKRRLPVELVVEILLPVAKALDYAHKKLIQLADGDEREGVLHRDVKPDNILVVLRDNRPREVWLIDFGLAAEIRSTMTRHTNVAVDTRGTRPYMSPEQLKGKRHQWDGRTDQYSLAVVAYQLLAGHLPFDCDDEFSLMMAINQETPDLISDVPEHVNAALLKGLAKTKGERFATCVEFLSSLQTIPKLPAVSRQSRDDKEPTADYVSSTSGLALVSIPSGRFLMGSPDVEEDRSSDEGPQHEVEISSFLMGRFPVTQEEFQLVMDRNPSDFRSVLGMDTSCFPVECVSWFDAIEFCNRLSERDRLAPSYRILEIQRREDQSIENAVVEIIPVNSREVAIRGYRLPTEAEWEYACRAGSTTPFHFGSALNGDLANVAGDFPYGTTIPGPVLDRTSLVGSYPPNAFGLHDMHGNVWQWCYDFFNVTAYDSRSGTTFNPLVLSGSNRVLRGGCFAVDALCARSASRWSGLPNYRSEDIGFRVVR